MGRGGVDFKGERDGGVAIVKRIGPAREAERANERASEQLDDEKDDGDGGGGGPDVWLMMSAES